VLLDPGTHVIYAFGFAFKTVCDTSSPYKRRREGTCKRIHNFRGESRLSETLCLPFAVLVTCVLVLLFSGILSDFSDPTTAPKPNAPPRNTGDHRYSNCGQPGH
jgi:hypothetical protein